MSKVIAMLVLGFCCSSCAGGATELNVATATTNAFGRVLAQVDAELSQQQRDARAAADKQFPADNAAYGAALATANAREDALAEAWREQGLLHVALGIWADSDEQKLWRNATACAAEAVQRLSKVLEQRWQSEISVAVVALQAGSGGASCSEDAQ